MKNSIVSLTIFSFLLLIVFSCSNSTQEVKQKTEGQDELITITKAQFNEEKMQLGTPNMHYFEEVIKTNGYLVPATNGFTEVNTHISGIVTSINLMPGDYVQKGQILCRIEGYDVITIQQEFKEVAASLTSLKFDYERLKILSQGNISSQKEFSTIESAYKSMLAKYSGLKSRLELLNLNPENVEPGQINSSVHILSPISGYIVNQNCKLGQFVNSQNKLMEIVDIDKLHLKFYVFEKNILKLKKDQLVRFYSPDATDKIYPAKLILIGKSIDPETKTIECIAQIEKSTLTNFANGMFMMVEIVSNKTETLALPDEAITKSGDHFYILEMEKEDNENYYFKQTAVKPSTSQHGFTAIEISEKPTQVLIKGLYNLQVD